MSTHHNGSEARGGRNATFDSPDVSTDDLFRFHQAHFSDGAVSRFQDLFFKPRDASGGSNGADAHEEEYWEEEDDLGYYDDGVKRTLTDEQIEIFRHSELRSLQRQKEKEGGRSQTATDMDSDAVVKDAKNGTGPETWSLPSTFQSGKKRKKRKGASRPKVEPKPDLRKRTWDMVDKGVDSLDYD